MLVPIANGSEEMEAVIIVDILRRAGAKVVVASVESETAIIASRKVKLVADTLISDVLDTTFDLILLPVHPFSIHLSLSFPILKSYITPFQLICGVW